VEKYNTCFPHGNKRAVGTKHEWELTMTPYFRVRERTRSLEESIGEDNQAAGVQPGTAALNYRQDSQNVRCTCGT